MAQVTGGREIGACVVELRLHAHAAEGGGGDTPHAYVPGETRSLDVRLGRR